MSRTIPSSQYETNLWLTHVNIVRLAEPIRRCVHWRTQIFKIEGFVCKCFLPSLPPPPTFIFLALVSFLAWSKPRIQFLSLSLLRNQTETLATQAKFQVTWMIEGFIDVWNFLKYFFGWFDLSRDFLCIQNNLKIHGTLHHRLVTARDSTLMKKIWKLLTTSSAVKSIKPGRIMKSLKKDNNNNLLEETSY